MTRPYLSKERTSDFDTFWKHGREYLLFFFLAGEPLISLPETTLHLLQNIAQKQLPVINIQDLMARFTIDAVTQLLLGICIDTLKRPLPVAGQATMGARGSTRDDLDDYAFGSFIFGENDSSPRI